MGVAIWLSRSGVAAWQAAGSEVHDDLGPRAIAARLLIRDGHTRRQRGAFWLNSYAPVSTAPDAEWDAYYDTIVRALGRMRHGDMLIWTCDANASVGRGSLGVSPDTRFAAGSEAVGPFGFDHLNASGRRLRTFMELYGLRSLSTFFRKRHYGTWQHPRSKLPHQLDHIIVACRDHRRGLFSDAGSWKGGQLVDSDHRAVLCKVNVQFHMRKRPPAVPRTRLAQLDYTELYSADGRADFAHNVVAAARQYLSLIHI